MIEVTRLYCPESGAQPGDDNSTHHLAPTGYDGGTRCRYCGKAPGTIRAEAEERCPDCGGLNGTHGVVHVRHDNGGGHNRPCPQIPAVEDEETPVDVADRIVHDAKTRDLLRAAYALTHKIHEGRKNPVFADLNHAGGLSGLMASRESLSTEIRRRARPVGMARARGLFIALDGALEPTVWQDRRTQNPEALVRRCDVPEVVWDLLAEIIDHRSAEA